MVSYIYIYLTSIMDDNCIIKRLLTILNSLSKSHKRQLLYYIIDIAEEKPIKLNVPPYG